MSTIKNFDSITCELKGLFLIEAAAGTGKTYNIQNLVVRAILEQGIPIEKLLVVTYTRAAAGELAERIRRVLTDTLMVLDKLEKYLSTESGREKLLARIKESKEKLSKDGREAFEALEKDLSSGAGFEELLTNALKASKAAMPKSGREIDLLVQALKKDGIDSQKCRSKLQTALLNFDAATITTIHGFCQKVLQENALESGVMFSSKLGEDCSKLLEKCAEDLYRREFYPNVDTEHTRLRQALLRQVGYTADRLVELAQKCILRPDLKFRFGAEVKGSIEEHFTEVIEIFDSIRSEGNREFFDIFPKIFNKPFGGEDFEQFISAYQKFIDDSKLDENSVPGDGFWKIITVFTKEALEGALSKKKKNDEFDTKEKREKALAEILASPLIDQFYRLAELTSAFGYTVLIRDINKLIDEYNQAKLLANQQTFDDLIRNVYQALTDPKSTLPQTLQQKYRFGVVDEFQDTDPLQYEIFKKIFIEPVERDGKFPDSTLFLVGDPRQAIYGFRGGDIITYEKAKSDIPESGLYTLTQNYRSAAKMIEAINKLFSKHASPFASDKISLPEISAPVKPDWGNRKEPTLLINGCEDDHPLRITDLPEDDADSCLKIAVDIVNNLLCDKSLSIPLSPSENPGDQPSSENEISGRSLRPGDIAILVKNWQEAYDLKPLLAAKKISAVIFKGESVYESDEAKELLTVLAAVASPQRIDKVLAALATNLGGCALEKLLFLRTQDGSDELTQYQDIFAQLHRDWRPGNFISIFTRLLKKLHIPARLAQQEGGERRLTNLYQLGDLLQQESSRRKLSITGLLNFLGDAIEKLIDSSAEENQQLLETDRNSVKITTIHSSKGLEYPIVILPSLFRFATYAGTKGENFHDEESKLVYELRESKMTELGRDETIRENLRLAYVALTRAKYRCHVLWGKNGEKSDCNSPLDWLFKCRDVDPADAVAKPNDLLRQRKKEPRQLLPEFEEKDIPVSGQAYCPELDCTQDLRVWKWKPGVLNRNYLFASFTSISPAVSGPLNQVNPGQDHDDTQPEEESPVLPETGQPVNSALSLPGGMAFGNAIHEIFEELDFAAPLEDIKKLTEGKLHRYGLLPKDESELANSRIELVSSMVVNTLNANLQDKKEVFTLSQIKRADRLSELKFLFELGSLSQNAKIRDLLVKYAKDEFQLDMPADWKIPVDGGFFNGFIDLVFRRHTPAGDRYYIVDWKTNRLDGNPENFKPDRLPEAMSHSYYFLQYLFYLVALVKFLRTRGKFDENDYESSFGGVYYMFLRGIEQGDSPNGRGIFFDKPDFKLVKELEELIS